MMRGDMMGDDMMGEDMMGEDNYEYLAWQLATVYHFCNSFRHQKPLKVFIVHDYRIIVIYS